MGGLQTQVGQDYYVKDLMVMMKEFNVLCATDQEVKLEPTDRVQKFSSREPKQLFNGQNGSKMELSSRPRAWQKRHFSLVCRARIKLPGMLVLQGLD